GRLLLGLLLRVLLRPLLAAGVGLGGPLPRRPGGGLPPALLRCGGPRGPPPCRPPARPAPPSPVSSAWLLMVFRTPATGEGTSVSTLSVDTSNSGSSPSTPSPRRLLATVMVSSAVAPR